MNLAYVRNVDYVSQSSSEKRGNRSEKGDMEEETVVAA